MPMVQSRVNGLRIFIPTEARGVIGRFATQQGNELIFVKPTDKNIRETQSEEPLEVQSEAPDRQEKAPDAQDDINPEELG